MFIFSTSKEAAKTNTHATRMRLPVSAAPRHFFGIGPVGRGTSISQPRVVCAYIPIHRPCLGRAPDRFPREREPAELGTDDFWVN